MISAALLSPLVLPPTVLGYYLLMLIGARGAIGRTLDLDVAPDLAPFDPEAFVEWLFAE